MVMTWVIEIYTGAAGGGEVCRNASQVSLSYGNIRSAWYLCFEYQAREENPPGIDGVSRVFASAASSKCVLEV